MNDQIGSGEPNAPDRDARATSDVYEARITGTRETLARVIQTFELDVGCRHPDVERHPDGTGTLLAYATKERIRELENAGYKVAIGENVSELARRTENEIGKGDRFEGGKIAPRGLGVKPGFERKGGGSAS